jgi:hypothetical protein
MNASRLLFVRLRWAIVLLAVLCWHRRKQKRIARIHEQTEAAIAE